MSKIYFFSYGDDNFKLQKVAILKQAIQSNMFDDCKVYSPSDISLNFLDKYNDIFINKRGAGYWIWKFYFIKKYLYEIMDEGDYLIYCDAGCTINSNGKARFNEYLLMLKNSDYGFISFDLKHNEKFYTIKEMYNYFHINKDETGQYSAAQLIIKKCSHSIKIIDECFKLLEYNKFLITDNYNNNQEPYFKDARHDQSIFSLCRKKYGSIVINDQEEWCSGDYNIILRDKPFWSTRIRM